ncbi:hypothetical protein EP7_005413 [Isosphaeraceae bacterium EP7]
MSNRRKAHLDALEARLTGPRRIALFGHRDVGKTTLLAMFYRQASTGQIPGLRLAAVDATSAEYLAEKIAQIESGEPPAGTLAETELRLRLYHGRARFDLIVRDYQGEHVTLGSDEPIQAFFAECDAVLLCLDPEGPASPAERRRRQQEVENLLERYIEKSDDATTDRPVALVLTKFDRVPYRDEGDGAVVEHLVEARYGMTRHLLSTHAPRSAMFAVSSYGHGAVGGRPPAELHPMGLEGPLVWLAEQLEAGDHERLEWLWDLAPDDLPRLSRCVASYEQRYPRSERLDTLHSKLATLRRRRNRRVGARLVLALGLLVAGVAGYDALGFQAASTFERNHAAPAVAKRWEDLIAWHPSMGVFWPSYSRRAERKLAEWRVKAADVRETVGAPDPGLTEQLTRLKVQSPDLAPAIKKVEERRSQAEHDARWKALKADALAAADQPEKPMDLARAFLREFPDSAHKDEALALINSMRSKVDDRAALEERDLIDDLVRASKLPNADLADVIARAQIFMSEHPRSRWRGEANDLLERSVKQVDDRDIERARQFSRDHRTSFAARIERYDDYLKAHRDGGQSISEATEAKNRILAEWDAYSYRLAYDHWVAHPDDAAEVATRLRSYLQDHPDGHYTRDAQTFVTWWEKVIAPGQYRVTLKWGEFPPEVGKNLAVVLEVAGVTHGPSPVIPNTLRPIWQYTFPRPITWKLGDPVTIKVVRDVGWFSSNLKPLITLQTPKGDALGMRLLTGPIKPSRGGKTTLVFESDFAIPRLTRPD